MNKERRFITILFLLSILLFFLLIKSYIGVVIFAIITAFFSSGLYKKIYKKTKKTRIALWWTWLVIALTVIAPTMLIATTTVQQVGVLADDVGEALSKTTPSTIPPTLTQENVQQLFGKIEDYAKKHNIDVDAQKIYQKWFYMLRNIASNITSWLYTFALNIFNWFTALFLYVIVVSGLLLHQDELLETLKRILPLDEGKTNRYIKKVSAMMNAIIKWTFVIAIIQGIITGVSFAIGGVPYFSFWTLIVIFASLIPMVGAGVIAFPIWIILLLTGSIRQGIMILIVNLLIVGNIDTILRPRLVKGEAKINGTLLILSIFWAMAIFGFMGIFYGPVIMIFILTSIHYYLEQVK